MRYVRLSILSLIGLSLAVISLSACSTDPNRAQHLDTRIDRPQTISGNETLGLKSGDMVIQRKVLMSEELRNLQDDVYELQDHVYGSEEFGSLGIYGVLKSCRLQLSEPDNGGDGHLKWTESRDLVAPETEAPQKIGLDEQDQIVGVSEEYLKDRIARFEQYKQVLQAREQRLQTKLEVCQLALKAHTERAGQAAKIAAGP